MTGKYRHYAKIDRHVPVAMENNSGNDPFPGSYNIDIAGGAMAHRGEGRGHIVRRAAGKPRGARTPIAAYRSG